MASILLSSVGASVGNAILPGLGGRLLGAFARKVGHVVDGEIGWSTRDVPKDGARLESFKVQDSRYGIAIPVMFGRARVAGNVIWVSDLIETAHEETVKGGKGGVVSDAFTSTRTTYTYSVNCAIALGEGEICGVQTIWADSKIIYQNGVWKSGTVASAVFHEGAKDQAVDPLLEGWIGAGLTPAYRGIAYVVIEGLQLKGFGNRLPNLTFEVLPKVSSGSQTWLGNVNPDVMHHAFALRHGGMKPIVVDGGGVSARRMIVGGYVSDGLQGAFTVIEVDMTGDTPLEIRRDQSALFTCQDVGDHAWALSPDKRFVAMGLQDASSGNPYHVALFDTQTNSFGSIVSVSRPVSQVRQIVWLDALHFAVTDSQDGKAGVRVYLRSGSGCIDLGFYDVWGEGSATTRVPVGYTQFMPYGDGVIMMMGDRALNFTALYARYMAWQKNGLALGDAYTVCSGVNVGSGSGPQVSIQKSGEDEWTLFYMTLIDMQMMSFVPTKTGATITRSWQRLTSGAFTSSSSNAPVLCGSRAIVFHRPTTENGFRVSEIELNGGSFALISDAVPVPDFVSPSAYINAAMIDPLRYLVMGNVGFSGSLGLLGVIRRRNAGDALNVVVASLLKRAGYAESDYDVTALADESVDGYVLTEQATAAGAIETLRILKPFDLVERDGKLVAVLQGEGEAITIDQAHAGAYAEGGNAPTPIITRSRAQELDLPVEVSVDYHDLTRDYEVSSQRARRTATKGATTHVKVEMPLTCTPAAAKNVAERLLYAAWVERDRFRLAFSRSCVGIDPADVIEMGDVRLRVMAVSHKDGVVLVDGVRDVAGGFDGQAVADGGWQGGSATIETMPTSLMLMDLPLLRNEDNGPGVYVAASGLQSWPGATLWRADDGVSFSNQASLQSAAIMGQAVTALPNRPTTYRDRVSTVRVQLMRGTLSSCTEAELMNGANAALLGGEIIQFQQATLVDQGLYELSNLLRGRKGTEDQTGAHGIGEAFVMLSAASVKFLPATLSDRNRQVHFRAVTAGGSIDYAQDTPFVYSLRSLQPLAPTHVRGVRAAGAGSDLTISWKRRARMNAAWVDYIDVPLDEEAELYDVEIMNGSIVVRTFNDVAARSVLYTAAQQTSDWGATPPASYSVRVYQKSARYGRGKEGVGSV